MKTLDYGNKSGFKVIDNNVVLNDNNSSEFLSYVDVASARTLNRPARNLYENQEEIYNLIQSLLKSVYGNFIGIVPNIYEGFSKDRFKYSEMAGNKFLRLPTGILYLRKDIQNDHSYYIPGEEQYQDDITPDLLIEDKNYSVVNQPNVNMFERQLAELIGLDLNDQANDIKVNCEFVDNIPHYSIKITTNTSDEENPQKVVELPKLFFNSLNGLVEERNILFRDNAIDIFNDFLEFYEDEITLPDSQIYKLNCLEPLIPIDSSFEEGMTYYLYYKVKGKESDPSSFTDLSKKFFLSSNAIRPDAVKLFSFKYANNEDVYDEITPIGTENPTEEGWYELVNDTYVLSEDTTVDSGKTYYSKTTFTGLRTTQLVDTLDQRLIATKRAELDTLLVRRRSNINGDVFMENGDINISIENNEIDIKDGDTNINITEDKISSTSESIENKSDNFGIENAEITLKNTKGLKVTRTNEEEQDEEILSAEVDENKEVKIKYKEEDLLEVRDNENDNEITTHKTIAPSEDMAYDLGTETRRFNKIYGDLEGKANATLLYNSGNVVISGLELAETRNLDHDIGKKFLSDSTIVYHFDTDFKDNHGGNTLTYYDAANSEITVKFDEESQKYDNPVHPYTPYEKEGKYAAAKNGTFNLSKEGVQITGSRFTVDFWYRYNRISEMFSVKINNGPTLSIENTVSEIDFYSDATTPFYKPSEIYENYSGTGYVEPGYTGSDFGTWSNIGSPTISVSPIYFMKKDESVSSIVAKYNGTTQVLKDGNDNPIAFAVNDWLHVCISGDNSGSGAINLFINNDNDTYSYSFNNSDNISSISFYSKPKAIDELMFCTSAKETLADFSNPADGLNWAPLSYTDRNFVLDVGDKDKLSTNLFETTVFQNLINQTTSSFFICNSGTSDNKEIKIPNGYALGENSYLKVVFINGHESSNSDSMTLTVKNFDGSATILNKAPILFMNGGNCYRIKSHNVNALAGNNTYYTLNPRRTLELMYTTHYDSSNNVISGSGNEKAFVILGNPVVLSSWDYTIYADGKVGDDMIGTIKPFYSVHIPYGWLVCDGGNGSGNSTGSQTFDINKYNTLYALLGTNKVPDLRECALVGVGTNGTFSIGNHDAYNLGEFKDDQMRNHTHNVNYYSEGVSTYGSGNVWKHTKSVSSGGVNGDRVGDVTRGKRIGVRYLIKAL